MTPTDGLENNELSVGPQSSNSGAGVVVDGVVTCLIGVVEYVELMGSITFHDILLTG
jgi:hypothetical protein